MRNTTTNKNYSDDMLTAIRLTELGGFFKNALRIKVRSNTNDHVEMLAFELCGSNQSEYIELAQRLYKEVNLYTRLFRRRLRENPEYEYADEWIASVSAKYILDDLRGSNSYPRRRDTYELLLCQRIQWLLDNDEILYGSVYEDEFELTEFDYDFGMIDDIITDMKEEVDSDE